MKNSDMIAGRFLKRQVGKQRLSYMLHHLATGKYLCIHTMTRVIKITPQRADCLKLGKSGSLYVQCGKRLDCIDWNPVSYSTGCKYPALG